MAPGAWNGRCSSGCTTEIPILALFADVEPFNISIVVLAAGDATMHQRRNTTVRDVGSLAVVRITFVSQAVVCARRIHASGLVVVSSASHIFRIAAAIVGPAFIDVIANREICESL